MSGLRGTSHTSQTPNGPTLNSEQRSTLDRRWSSLFELSGPYSERCSGGAKSQINPGCTTPTMKDLFKLLFLKPISFLLLIAFVLSAGIAVRLAGPISIQTHRVELPDLEIRIGNTEGVKSPSPQTTTTEPLKKRRRVRHVQRQMKRHLCNERQSAAVPGAF